MRFKLLTLYLVVFVIPFCSFSFTLIESEKIKKLKDEHSENLKNKQLDGLNIKKSHSENKTSKEDFNKTSINNTSNKLYQLNSNENSSEKNKSSKFNEKPLHKFEDKLNDETYHHEDDHKPDSKHKNTINSNHNQVRNCLQLIPDAATKCYRQYQEHLQFIESSAWTNEPNEKRNMFCCALWDWRKCVFQLAHVRCQPKAIAAIEVFEPLTTDSSSNKTERPLCADFDSGSNHCQSLSGWAIMAIIAVITGIVVGLYWVLKKDRGTRGNFQKVSTINESDENDHDDEVFIDPKSQAQVKK